MNNTQEIYEQLEQLWNDFSFEHNRFKQKNVKAAGVRARKAIGDFKKLVTDYRKLSVSESKELNVTKFTGE